MHSVKCCTKWKCADVVFRSRELAMDFKSTNQNLPATAPYYAGQAYLATLRRNRLNAVSDLVIMLRGIGSEVNEVEVRGDIKTALLPDWFLSAFNQPENISRSVGEKAYDVLFDKNLDKQVANDLMIVSAQLKDSGMSDQELNDQYYCLLQRAS